MAPTTRSQAPSETIPEPSPQRSESPSRGLEEALRRHREILEGWEEVNRLRQRIQEQYERSQNAPPPPPLPRGTQEPTQPPSRRSQTPLVPTQEEEDEAPRPKRQRRDSSEERPRRRPKAKEPDPYFGKNQKELEVFLRQCRNYIRMEKRSFVDEVEQVHWAITYLRGEAADAWSRHEKDTYGDEESAFSWKEFEVFHKDWLADPANRLLNAFQKYDDARQKEGQSIQNFASYLEELEAILPPYSEEQRAGHLFMRMKPSLRKDILAKGDMPSTRREVLALAQRFEGIQRIESRQQSDPSRQSRRSNVHPHGQDDGELKRKSEEEKDPKGSRSGRGSFGRKRRGESQSTPGSNRQPTEEDKSKVECFRCRKKGHYANECRSKFPAEKDKTGS